METSKINKLIKYKLFLLIPNQEKVDLIINKTFNIKTTNSLINTLNDKSKKDTLKYIYLYQNITSYTEKDTQNLFKLLSYQNKLTVLKALDNLDINSYLNLLRVDEGIRIINNSELDTDSRIYIIDNILPQETRINLFKFGYFINDSISLAIIKHLDEDMLRKALKKRRGLTRNLTNENFAVALSYLPTVEEKLALLNKDNEYKVELTENQKIKIIMTTNDEERMKVIKDPKIEKHEKIEVIKTLTDEGKLSLLANKKEMEKHISGYAYTFYDSFSKELVRKTIFNLNLYNIDKYYLDNLIKRLEPAERIEIIYTENHCNIPLSEIQISAILKSLPEEYKLELVNQKNYLNLNQKQIVDIIQNMKPQSIIKLLVKEDTHNFTNQDIWKIIESLSKKDAIYFLDSKDPDIIKFTEKYKTSFSKCLDNQDKIEIIYNKSKYGIRLEDEKKLKLLKTLNLYHQKDLLEDNIFKYFDNPDKIIEKLVNDKKEFNKLETKIQEHIAEYLTKNNENKDMILISINILKYTENSKELLNKFEKFKNLLQKLNINISDFIQYGINSNKYKWDIIILDIINNNKTNEFINIKQYFDKFYYNNKEDKKKNIENFLELLNAYSKYELFCKNLTDKNQTLTKENKQDIQFLFKSNITGYTPALPEDIKKIRNILIKSYKIITLKTSNLYELKNALLNLFFGKNAYEITVLLQNTGYTQELNILKFNNRQNQEYSKIIEHVMLMTEFIERILNTNDINGLKETLDKYTKEENLETTKKYINYCSKYEEYIRKLYELDIQISLTKINKLDEKYKETTYAKEISKKYGGIAYDLTDSKYVLMAHVKSKREKIDNLLLGVSDSNSNFICMSPLSHRGQHYYSYTEHSIVFAYDTVPNNSFICSSVDNLGSNSCLSYNTTEVPEISRVQKGILETSEASSHKNAEVLLYREGIKPAGIIIPKGTVPCEKAIEYHQKYNIPFVLTQEIDKTIENPNEIKNKNEINNINEFKDLEILQELELKEKSKKERRIAIITDPHALYEPTMACLTDVKNKGIEEIYSLGDNIGHGPSPKETLELLSLYNVKSVLGNHELYIIKDNAIEIFKNHLVSTGALERTIDMINWIKQEITKKQYEEIKKYKDKYEIMLPNEEKITLIHTQEPYNKEGLYSNEIKINDSIAIIKGHKHFASQIDEEYILRAVGIGQRENDDGLATYAILTITEDDYFIEICNVPYNRSNLLHTINESSMPNHAKSLIKSWVSKK